VSQSVKSARIGQSTRHASPITAEQANERSTALGSGNGSYKRPQRFYKAKGP